MLPPPPLSYQLLVAACCGGCCFDRCIGGPRQQIGSAGADILCTSAPLSELLERASRTSTPMLDVFGANADGDFARVVARIEALEGARGLLHSLVNGERVV